MKFNHCPDCGDVLSPGADHCSCGWKDPTLPRTPKRNMPGSNTLCAVRGCQNLGTAKPGLRGEGLWYCRHHVDPEDRHKPAPAIQPPGMDWRDVMMAERIRS